MSFKENVIKVKDGIVNFCYSHPEVLVMVGGGLVSTLMYYKGFKAGWTMGYRNGFLNGEAFILKLGESLKK